MKKEIIIAGRKIGYSIRKYSRAKHLRLAINSRGCLVASKPWYLSNRAVARFISDQAQWVIEKLELSAQTNNYQVERLEYLAHKEQARELVLKKIEKFNSIYQFKFSRVSIRQPKTRWGSCSSRGNLNFNYKLVFLPEPMVDYIVVHELAHFKKANHSHEFWELVESVMPNYREKKNWLRVNGANLDS